MADNVLEIINEKSTKSFMVPITDLAGAAVIPTAFKWHLLDRNDNVINELENQLEPLSSSVTITLAGDDLQIVDQDSDLEYRVLVVETDMGDAALPEKDQIAFWVRNLHKTT